MAKDLGWIKLHRSSFNNRLYFSEPFTRWQAWCDLLLLANHKSGMFRVRGIKVEVLRGQTGFSAVELADRWRWSRGKVNRFLVELKDEHQIVQQKSNVTTLISIVNYDKYQNDGTANGTQVGTHIGTLNGQKVVQQTDINKNDNKEKNGEEEKEIVGQAEEKFDFKKILNPVSFPTWREDVRSFLADEYFIQQQANDKKITYAEIYVYMEKFVYEKNLEGDFKNTPALKKHFGYWYKKHIGGKNGRLNNGSISNGFIEVPQDFDYDGENVVKW